MKARHRRRSVVHAESIAPWLTLSVILLLWWVGATAVHWLSAVKSGGIPPATAAVDHVEPEPALTVPSEGPAVSTDTRVFESDLENLRSRSLLIPVRGQDADDLVSSFVDARGSREHEAIDILAPRGTEVLAVEDGRVAKLFTSKAGGLTIYHFDPSEQFVYYYAHLDRYAPGLTEGMTLKKGDVIGYVGTTGNAPESTPHLHFAIAKLDPDRRWWGGTALDPFLVWHDPSSK